MDTISLGNKVMQNFMTIVLAMALIAFTSSRLLANDIYITQSGNGLDLDITQDGNNNNVTLSMHGNNNTLNIDALGLITKLEATNHYTFDNLEARFAVAGTTLDVTVDVSNLSVYLGTVQVTSITSTIDIV